MRPSCSGSGERCSSSVPSGSGEPSVYGYTMNARPPTSSTRSYGASVAADGRPPPVRASRPQRMRRREHAGRSAAARRSTGAPRASASRDRARHGAAWRAPRRRRRWPACPPRVAVSSSASSSRPPGDGGALDAATAAGTGASPSSSRVVHRQAHEHRARPAGRRRRGTPGA